MQPSEVVGIRVGAREGKNLLKLEKLENVNFEEPEEKVKPDEKVENEGNEGLENAGKNAVRRRRAATRRGHDQSSAGRSARGGAPPCFFSASPPPCLFSSRRFSSLSSPDTVETR